jgi:hypothetical protein
MRTVLIAAQCRSPASCLSCHRPDVRQFDLVAAYTLAVAAVLLVRRGTDLGNDLVPSQAALADVFRLLFRLWVQTHLIVTIIPSCGWWRVIWCENAARAVLAPRLFVDTSKIALISGLRLVFLVQRDFEQPQILRVALECRVRQVSNEGY